MKFFHNRPKSYEMDMCHGPIFTKLVAYAIPLMLSGILQLLYNAADIVVVGRFAGSTALAAVGSTGSLIGLVTNLFFGLSTGASVVAAQAFGAGAYKDVSDTVQTSMTVSGILGVLLLGLGCMLAVPLLRLTGSPDDVIHSAALYMRIYFLGMPGFMVYNFGAAILRAMGDTRRPLYFLTLSGAVNVVLNLIFVLGFHMTVDGVAWATVASQYLSAIMVLTCLIRSQGAIHFDVQHLCIRKKQLLDILRVGLPAGLQSSLFSISNVLIQSAVNSFGSVAMAGNAAAANIEGFVYTSMNAMAQAATTFSGQNYGAKTYKRLKRIALLCVVTVTGIGLVIGLAAWGLARPLLGIYTSDSMVVERGLIRMGVIATTYFLCGIMDVMAGILRGMGRSVLTMVISLAGACGFRILWLYTYFLSHRTMHVLYVSYPISWLLTGLCHSLFFVFVVQKLIKQQESSWVSEQES